MRKMYAKDIRQELLESSSCSTLKECVPYQSVDSQTYEQINKLNFHFEWQKLCVRGEKISSSET